MVTPATEKKKKENSQIWYKKQGYLNGTVENVYLIKNKGVMEE